MYAPSRQERLNRRKDRLNLYNRGIYLERQRRRLRSGSFSIISNNCIAGAFYHDMGMEHLSPTVNLLFGAGDYIEFVEHLPRYLSADLAEDKLLPGDPHARDPHPVGLLGGRVRIHFLHYAAFGEAKDAWYRRRERVNPDGIFLVMLEKYGCTPELMERFLQLDYPKVFFATTKPIDHPDVVFTPIDIEQLAVPGGYCWVPGSDGKRPYERFDFVSWLNSNGEIRAEELV